MSSSSSTPKMGGDRLRIPPVALAIGFAALVGAALILISGHDPLSAYAEIAKGSLSPAALPDTLNWATPLVGMTLAAAIPLRGGMVNLGGDGQIVIGGLIGALAVVFVERRTSAGYELRMRGKNPRFARYGGVRLGPQAVRAMFASGAIAGLVGAIVVLGSQFRFIDGALITPAYTWSGLMAALLVSGEPVGAIVAALFFAALQTGGFAMQRETSVPRVLTLVLQAIVILFLAMRRGLGRRT